jgi:predicted nucleic acid-binding Zn ribbon protein
MDNRYRKNKGFTLIGDVLDKVVPHHRPKTDQAMIQVWDIWESAVGAEIAAHARPAAFRGDLLLVHVSNSAMLHHMRFMEKEMIRNLNQAIGAQQVRALKFKIGPI